MAFIGRNLTDEDGYGIGLYQCAKLARQNGYDINLAHNENGRICFEINNLIVIDFVYRNIKWYF